MSFDHIKDNFMEYCFGLLAAWIVALMVMSLALSAYQSAQATFGDSRTPHIVQDRNARGCLVKDNIEICEKA